MKHAYLILAHNQFSTLKKLLFMLDDSRNDIYLHIDAKVKKENLPELNGLIQNASISFLPRVPVYWGHISRLEVLFHIFSYATKKYHDYYHVLSGVCLPIKNQDHIDTFFEKHSGMEFVHFNNAFSIKNRFAQKRFLTKYYRCGNPIMEFISKGLDKISLTIQRTLGYNKLTKTDYKICYGADWFSITHQAAKYFLSKKDEMLRLYKYSSSPSEGCIQTVLFNSSFLKNIYKYNEEYSHMRYIDWTRKGKYKASPYIFRLIDWPSLQNSNLLFARKFDDNVDSQIINKIVSSFG